MLNLQHSVSSGFVSDLLQLCGKLYILEMCRRSLLRVRVLTDGPRTQGKKCDIRILCLQNQNACTVEQ